MRRSLSLVLLLAFGTSSLAVPLCPMGTDLGTGPEDGATHAHAALPPGSASGSGAPAPTRDLRGPGDVSAHPTGETARFALEGGRGSPSGSPQGEEDRGWEHHGEGGDHHGGDELPGGVDHHGDGERCAMPMGCGVAGLTVAGFASPWALRPTFEAPAPTPAPPAPRPRGLESPPPRPV